MYVCNLASGVLRVLAISDSDLLVRHIVHNLHFWRAFNPMVASGSGRATVADPVVGIGKTSDTAFLEECGRISVFRFVGGSLIWVCASSSSSIIITSWFSLGLVFTLRRSYRFFSKMNILSFRWRLAFCLSRIFRDWSARFGDVRMRISVFIL